MPILISALLRRWGYPIKRMTNELTVTEAAARCGVGPDAIRRALAAGVLAGRKVTPRLWLVDPADLPRDNAAWRARVPMGRPAAPPHPRPGTGRRHTNEHPRIARHP